MSNIRGKNTRPEILLRKELWRRGYRYSLKSKLPGKPDIAMPCRKTVIFVDGCFWHMCPDHFQMPANRKEFWKPKLIGNKERDEIVNRKLKKLGWKVIRIWEHEIKQDLSAVADKVESMLPSCYAKSDLSIIK